MLHKSNILQGIPPPIVSAANSSLEKAVSQAQGRKGGDPSSPQVQSSTTGAETIMKYMTFGLYGSSQTTSQGKNKQQQETPKLVSGKDSNETKPSQARMKMLQELEPKPIDSLKGQGLLHDVSKGCFLIGLKGDLEDEGETDEEDDTAEAGSSRDHGAVSKSLNSRILLRTLHVERKRGGSKWDSDDMGDC